MSSFVHEFRRIITSKSLIIAVLALVILSLLISVGSAVSSVSFQKTNAITTTYGTYSNGTYHLKVNMINTYGEPIRGMKVTLHSYNGTYSEVTNAAGFANFTHNNVNYSQTFDSLGNSHSNRGYIGEISYNQQNTNYTREATVFTGQRNPYFYQTYTNSTNYEGQYTNTTANFSRYEIFSIHDGISTKYNGLNILYRGTGNSTSEPVEVYDYGYNTANTSRPHHFAVNFTEKNMSYYETINGFDSVNIIPENLSDSGYSYYVFALFTPQGKSLGLMGLKIITPAPQSEVSSTFFQYEAELLGIFIPMVASLTAYSSFGRDRTSSVLESSLSRPVSRVSLLLSRYSGNMLSVVAASAAALGVSSFGLYVMTGTGLTLNDYLLALWGITVAVGGFIGLIYLSSVLARSQSFVLGAFIAITVVLGIFWVLGVIPETVIGPLGLDPSGNTYTTAMIAFAYASPASYLLMAGTLAAHLTFFNVFASAADLIRFGVSLRNMLVLGSIWIIVPLIVSIGIFRKRD